MTEKLDVLVIATPTAVVELEEMQGIIAEGQEKDSLAAEALGARSRTRTSRLSRCRIC